jgi:hypothetical protein
MLVQPLNTVKRAIIGKRPRRSYQKLLEHKRGDKLENAKQDLTT